MEKLTSRKGAYIRHLRALCGDGEYRRERGEYVCEGIKTLQEALQFGAQPRSVLWRDASQNIEGLLGVEQYTADAELFDYVSPLKSSPGPLFTVAIPPAPCAQELKNAVVLENVQDPGNVGTVVRTANAFGIDAVILCGDCADIYNPKTVRATMGAIFRERVIELTIDGLMERLDSSALPLYGAALSDSAADIRTLDLRHAAVAIGSEGRGLSAELLSRCSKSVVIPMSPESESLNAAVAAAVVMWEMFR